MALFRADRISNSASGLSGQPDSVIRQIGIRVIFSTYLQTEPLDCRTPLPNYEDEEEEEEEQVFLAAICSTKNHFRWLHVCLSVCLYPLAFFVLVLNRVLNLEEIRSI